MFVRAVEGEFSELGIGKQIDRRGQTALVEYFDSPSSETHVYSMDGKLVAQVSLPEQTRIYYFNKDTAAWEIGRVLDDQGEFLYVKFPNGTDRRLKPLETFVRWAKAISDPTAFLAAKINETPRFSAGRSGFVRSLVSQRGATIGMSAVVSSAIEMEAHQIEVVRRVLQDPVQRYLLADEVGLGKTIEAGMLIRQCHLDAPDVQILVVVPDALVQQWRNELTSKFFLGYCLDQSLHVVSYSNVERIKALLPGIAMLVIDEAHHLTERPGPSASSLYTTIARAAPAIERLILLSATPALHNERGFLEMLHLLDPDTYSLDDEPGFRQRVKNRQALAQIAAGLTPDNALFLDERLAELADLFPDDELLHTYARELLSVTSEMPSEDDPRLISAINVLRAHLSEVYRLHRRVLRHRRSSVGGLTPHRAGAHVIEYRSEEDGRLANTTEDWRFEESVVSADDSTGNARLKRASGYAKVLDHSSQYAASGNGVIGLLTRRPELVGNSEKFGRVAEQLNRDGRFEARLDALIMGIQPMLVPKQQVVIFCSDERTADKLAKGLEDRLKAVVYRHHPEDESWQAFNDNSEQAILVCDRRAEEGLNLQGGRKIVVHYDLPLNPNRVEQRLGRVDRYGSGDAIRSVVLNCLDNPLEGAWIGFLDKGLEIFNRSVASLQYFIEDMNSALAPSLFDGGLDALLELTEASAGSDGLIAKEMDSLDQQDALDALGVTPSELLDQLSDVDEDWQGLERQSNNWIEATLQFRRTVEHIAGGSEAKGAVPFRYQYASSGHATLVPLETFYAQCQSAVDRSQSAALARKIRTVPVTFRRRTALSRAGQSLETRVLRYGDPFITGMWSITQGDDRGRSTALWRYLPGHKSDGQTDLFFRFDFIVEADVSAANGVLLAASRFNRSSQAAALRRGDMALPPFFYTIWLNRDLDIVEDSSILRKLDLEYRPEAAMDGARDFNLNPKRWHQLDRFDIPELGHWSGLCFEARRRSEEILRTSPDFVRSLASAFSHASETDVGRIGQLAARAGRTGRPDDVADLELERALSKALLDGVIAPRIHLDAVRACFLSGLASAASRLDRPA
ncbi:protein DpdE [Pseudochrobactrum lubricantis]|uniref:protein DpdE n=1 Tax=Pseudochrobactrum lubricantis TaxID=558172 RepID=UPI0035DA5985